MSDEFLDEVELKSETIKVPKLGTVIVRELTLAERLKVERAAESPNAPSRTALMAVACTYREDGTTKRFTDADAAKIDRLGASRASLLTLKVGEINQLGSADEGDIEKN